MFPGASPRPASCGDLLCPDSGALGDLVRRVVPRDELLEHRLGRPHLRRTAPTALVGEDLAVREELATPHAPRLTPLDGRGEALVLDRALDAERLGPQDVVELLREEQVHERAGAVGAARVDPPGFVFDDFGGFQSEHFCSSPSGLCWFGAGRAGGVVRRAKREREREKGRRGCPGGLVSGTSRVTRRSPGTDGAGACGTWPARCTESTTSPRWCGP